MTLMGRVVKREFGFRIAEKEVAPWSVWDLGALLSPCMKGKKPRKCAALEMRGFLSWDAARSETAARRQTFAARRGEDQRPPNAPFHGHGAGACE